MFDFRINKEKAREKAISMASRIRYRGPDWSGVYSDAHAAIAHERLSIVDVENGAQPLVDDKDRMVLAVNGEIYNHMALRKLLKRKHEWKTKSDCEIILYLYEEYGSKCIEMLNGIFAFVIYNQKSGSYFIARDHLGIIPLYIGWDVDGATYVASEMKALEPYCKKMMEFPPGCYYDSMQKDFVTWYIRDWMVNIPHRKVSLPKLKQELEKAVMRQLMSDVPYGVLISGGLDSSIIAAIAMKYSKKRIESKGREDAWWPRLHSFSVGLQNSPDMKYARKVARYINTVHHEIVFSIEEGFDAIRNVIYHLETFDTTTIRAATPMYLMARKIKSMGIKMVLSGEGSDEVFGGYLYFHKAPNAKEFHEELVRKLSLLSKYDCLRANKSTAAWGLETRVPFLDKEFLDYAMSIDPEQKMCRGANIEKGILREAFKGMLPEEILWRQKEQFSDGVGYGWIDYLKKFAEEHITDKMMENAGKRFKVQTPNSKEQYYYRSIFSEYFKSNAAAMTVPVGPSIACSTPAAIKWSKEFKGMDDPSGRAISSIHKNGFAHL